MKRLRLLCRASRLADGLKRAGRAALAVAAGGWLAVGVAAADSGSLVEPPVLTPGGLGIQPVITAFALTGGVATVEWYGIQGPFQLQRTPVLGSGHWENLGSLTQAWAQSVKLAGDLGFLRVVHPTLYGGAAGSNQWMYVGRDTCTECHPTIPHNWYPSQNPPPHPPYPDCEECHGPGFYHVAVPLDQSLRPRNDPAKYMTATACASCHTNTFATWQQTLHASALATLQNAGQGNNPSCLPCHTVGFGAPYGFQDTNTTPQLANVQCENCHGPAGAHVGDTSNPSVRPPVTPAAEVCGGCHNGFLHATYDEWHQSGHGVPNADVAASILASGIPRMLSCGPCHSGAVRLALLRQLADPTSPLPSPADAANFPVTCPVCHDPHQASARPAQLRNPLFSTNNFSYSPAATNSFAAQYDPNIQVCGQCHNMRGARWDDTSRPPHHSPQYNLMVGQGGFDEGTSSIATHGLKIQQQCAHCHAVALPAIPPAADNPNYVGHTFEVRFDACAATNQAVACHPSPANAEGILALTQDGIRQRIVELKALLDLWATNKAPEVLRTKYTTLAWEYNSPGQLSNPAGDPSLTGPTAAEQTNVPPAIKQARFNLYLVEYDASGGAHNGKYARDLLAVGKTNVLNELGTP